MLHSLTSGNGQKTPKIVLEMSFHTISVGFCRPAYSLLPAIRGHLRVPTVIKIDVVLDFKGYRSTWYPYLGNFYET